MITVYRKEEGSPVEICQLPEDNAAYNQALMGSDEVIFDITVDQPLPVELLDYILYNGIIYTLNREPEYTKKSDVEYRYQMVFEAPVYTLLDKGYTYLITDETRFYLTGTLRDFLHLLVENINSLDSGWTVGECPETERKNLYFESISCGEVLNKLANDFEVEYHIQNKQINFYERYENFTPLVFEQGKGKGLYTLTQRNVDSENTVTRAILYGGTKNLPLGYRNGSEYLRWSDPITGKKYVENFSEYKKVVERDVYFEDIFPHFDGVVEAVYGENKEIVYCPAIDFNLNDYLIGGVTAKINFVTGDLTGIAFELTYDHTAKRVTLIRQEDETAPADEEGYRPLIPSDLRKPQRGDRFNFTDITLPDEYVKRAETELYNKGVEWLNFHAQLRLASDLSIDHRDLREKKYDLKVGDMIRTLVPEKNVDRMLRVISLEKNLKTGSLTCEVSNYPRYDSRQAFAQKVQAVVNEQRDRSAIKVLTSWDNADASEYNVFSSLRALKEIAGRALSRIRGDVAQGFIDFLAGLRSKRVEIGEFISGMIGGRGALLNVDPETGKSMLEIDRIHAREELIVPKITFNCIDVISGDKANTFAFGTFKSVDTDHRIAELDLLDDQLGTLKVNDICRGIFHNLTGGNSSENSEDGNGFFRYAGFSTAYFTPLEILENVPGVFRFRYALQPDTTVHPMPGMNFYAYGNFTDPDRQAMTYETRYYTRRLKNVNTWMIDPTRNISMQDGLLEGLTIGGMTMHGYGTFQENTYLTGVNIQFTPSQIEELQGKSAYNVSLSAYEKVVKLNAQGEVVSLIERANVVAGVQNVVAGDENVVTTAYSITTYIQAWKGDQELLFSEGVDKGKYVVAMNAVGCSAILSGGVLIVQSITDPENCYVDLKVNCEGNAVFEKRFSVTAVQDGSDGNNGNDGKYTELRYRDAVSRPATPVGINPSGWSLSPNLETIWPTHAGDFVLQGGLYVSPLPTQHSATYKQRLSFRTTIDNQVLFLELSVSSEESYDWGIVTRLNEAFSTSGSYLWKQSGIVTEILEVSVPYAGSHFIEIVYKKDGSIDQNQDCLKYRVVNPRRRWLSTAQIDPNTQTTGGWSVPVEFPVDSPEQEQIYLLAKSDIQAHVPQSDPFMDKFIGEAPEYDPQIGYSIDNIVKYENGYKVCTRPALGIDPSDNDHWEDVGWWTDHPTGASQEFPYEYVCIRRFSEGQWGNYEQCRLFMRYGRDGVTPLVTQLVPSVTQVGRTMTGSYEPESFLVKHQDTSGEPVTVWMAVWGSHDGNAYSRIGAVENVSSKTVNVAQYPYKYFVIRTYASEGAVWESEYLLSASVTVTEDGMTGAMPVYCGFYDTGVEYTYTNTTRDIISYQIDGEVLTFQVRVHGSKVTVPPTSSVGDPNWEPANKFKFVAMDTALIDGANIAGFMYKNLMMISRLGTLDGVDTDIKNVPESRIADFQPHIQMDGNTGEAVLNRVLIRGSLVEPFERYVTMDDFFNGRSYNWHLINPALLSGKILLSPDSADGKTLRIFNDSPLSITFSMPCYYAPNSSVPTLRTIVLPNYAMLEAKNISIWVSSVNQYVQTWLITSRYSFTASSQTITIKRFTE